MNTNVTLAAGNNLITDEKSFDETLIIIANMLDDYSGKDDVPR